MLAQGVLFEAGERRNETKEDVVRLDIEGAALMAGANSVVSLVVESVIFTHELPITGSPMSERAEHLDVGLRGAHTTDEIVDLLAEGMRPDPQAVERATEEFIPEACAERGMRVGVTGVLHVARPVQYSAAVTQIGILGEAAGADCAPPGRPDAVSMRREYSAVVFKAKELRAHDGWLQ